jgi:ABC-type bacteriocin/lantibiotic exporter with double-glycine peptidase domain
MADSSIKPMKRFWLLLKPDQNEIRNVYIYAIFSGLIGLSLPVGIQSIINLIQGAQMSTSWLVLVFFVILGIFINGILQINQLRITENLQQKIFTRAAFEFAYRVPRFKLNALIQKTAPELMNRFFDVISIQKGLSKVVIDFSTAGIQTLFGLMLLSIYHPFFIVFSVFLVLLIYIVFAITGKKGLRTSLEESKIKYDIALWLQEIGRSKIAFKMSNDDNLTMDTIDKSAEKYIKARESHFAVLVRQFKLLIGFKIIVAAGLLIIGSLLVMDQQMNIGQFVAAEIIILLVIGSVEKMILSLEVIYDILTALDKVGHVTDVPLDEVRNYPMQNEFGESSSVKLNEVNFSYSKEDDLIFKELSVFIDAGEKALITGKSSSGKKTLLSLISGLLTTNSGTISINGVPINNYNTDYLHHHLGLLTDEDCIFNGTIYENILMGRSNADFETMKWLVENLSLTRLIDNTPNGYHENIYNGERLSASTRYKILLARTLVTKPSLALIQDRLSLLDAQERRSIAEFLFSKEMPCTLIFVSNCAEFAPLAESHYEISNQVIQKIK